MLYETRDYYVVPGNLEALHERFASHTMGYFKQYGIGMMGFWTDEIGISNLLTYILTFDSMADREKKWGEFSVDPGWLQVRVESESSGPLVARVENSFMRTTAYSPEPDLTSKVQEMRVYDAVPGKLPALHDRFANHTMELFERHGMDNVAYWTEDVGTSNRLVYMLGYPSLGDREKSWAAFRGDPDWLRVRAVTEKDGPLIRESRHRVMSLTSYSPR